MSTRSQKRWELAFAYAANPGSEIDNPSQFADEYVAMAEDDDNIIFFPDRPCPSPEDFAYFYA